MRTAQRQDMFAYSNSFLDSGSSKVAFIQPSSFCLLPLNFAPPTAQIIRLIICDYPWNPWSISQEFSITIMITIKIRIELGYGDLSSCEFCETCGRRIFLKLRTLSQRCSFRTRQFQLRTVENLLEPFDEEENQPRFV